MRKAFHPSSRRTALAGASLVAHTSDFSSSVFEEDATIRNFRIVQTEGSRQVTRDTKHYSLQMIIAVGFKVNSERAVLFRKWVNQIAVKTLDLNKPFKDIAHQLNEMVNMHFKLDVS